MSVLETAIGWLAPPDCVVCGAEGQALCPACSTSKIVPFGERCWRCNRLSAGSKTCPSCYAASGLGHVWIVTNYEAAAQQLVQIYKFGHQRAAAQPLAQQMAKTLKTLNKTGRDYLVIPVPTATTHMRQRSFGHSELLAKKLSLKLHLDYSNGLHRLDQIRQLGSKRQYRLTQLADTFAVKHTDRIKGQDILLVDDVLTTGGSLITAAKVLKDAGAKNVDGLVFAKKL